MPYHICCHAPDVQILAVAERYGYVAFAAKCPQLCCPEKRYGNHLSMWRPEDIYHRVYIIVVDMLMIGVEGYKGLVGPCVHEDVNIFQHKYNPYLDKDHCALAICNDHLYFFTVSKKSTDEKTVLLYTRVRMEMKYTITPSNTQSMEAKKERITTIDPKGFTSLKEIKGSTKGKVTRMNVLPVIASFTD